MFKYRVLTLLLVAILLLAACGPEAPAAQPPAPEILPTVQPTAEAAPTAEPTPAGELRLPGGDAAELQRAVAAPAIDDLAQHLGVPAEQVQVVSVEEVVWPDASLGCPASGMMYAQVVTDGMKVVLEVDGQTYAYHGKTPDGLFLCGPDGPLAEELAPETRRSSTLSPAAQAIVNTVSADMAQQLGISQDQIEVLSVESREWRNSGLGCEKPGMMYLQVITEGYLIILAAGDDVYEYHTDTGGRYVLCSTSKR